MRDNLKRTLTKRITQQSIAQTKEEIQKNLTLKKEKASKLALFNSLNQIANEYYDPKTCVTIPEQYKNYDCPFIEQKIEKNVLDIEKINQLSGKQDDVEIHQQSYEVWKQMQFDYNQQMSSLWNNLKTKVIEKMSDSRKIMSEELR